MYAVKNANANAVRCYESKAFRDRFASCRCPLRVLLFQDANPIYQPWPFGRHTLDSLQGVQIPEDFSLFDDGFSYMTSVRISLILK